MLQEFMQINASEHYDYNEMIQIQKILVTLKFANFLQCNSNYYIEMS